MCLREISSSAGAFPGKSPMAGCPSGLGRLFNASIHASRATLSRIAQADATQERTSASYPALASGISRTFFSIAAPSLIACAGLYSSPSSWVAYSCARRILSSLSGSSGRKRINPMAT